MKKRPIPFLLFIVLLSATLFSSLQATPLSQKALSKQAKAKLSGVTKNILTLKKDLKIDQAKQEKLMNDLKTTELSIARISHELEATQKQYTHAQTTLERLKSRLQKQQTQFNQQQRLFMQQLRTHYQMGHAPPIKLLLNHQNPASLNRLFHYHRLMIDERKSFLTTMLETLQSIQATQATIASQARTLHAALRDQQAAKIALAQEHVEQERMVHQIAHLIQNKSDKLRHLSEDEKSLRQVIKKLRRQQFARPSLGFLQHHDLALPVKGKIQTKFGDLLEDTNLHANGIFIKAPANQAVRAIYPGKVIFADWLRGLGLIVIVDHGDAYLSLYAHNQSLYVKTGETVGQNTILARVGHSGGYLEDGLYFEIRHKGKPQNPLQWCHAG